MGARARVLLWVAVGLAVVIGLAWLGETDPLRSTSDINVTAGTGSDASAEAVLVDMFIPDGYLGTALVPASASHVATAVSDRVKVDLYTYDSVFEDRGAMRCALSTSADGDGGGAGGGCPDDAQSSPHFGGGISSGSSRVGSRPEYYTHTVTVAWAGPAVAWAVVETPSGKRIKSNVVDGYSIVMWKGPFDDQAETITLFDNDANLLLAEERTSIPPVPGIAEVGRAVEVVANDS